LCSTVDISRDTDGAYLSSLVIETETTRKAAELRAKLSSTNDPTKKEEKVEKQESNGKNASRKRKKPALEKGEVRNNVLFQRSSYFTRATYSTH